MIRFIHTADWQLGKPFGRMPEEVRAALQEARLDAIDAIGKLASDRGADDVLVAGDVFDTFEPGERVVRQALTRMGRAKCRWWLLPGNHDYARAEGLWARLARDAPSNVRALVVAEPVAMGEHAVILTEVAGRMQVIILTCRKRAFMHLAANRVTLIDGGDV